jgi:hypothetical protein
MNSGQQPLGGSLPRSALERILLSQRSMAAAGQDSPLDLSGGLLGHTQVGDPMLSSANMLPSSSSNSSYHQEVLLQRIRQQQEEDAMALSNMRRMHMLRRLDPLSEIAAGVRRAQLGSMAQSNMGMPFFLQPHAAYPPVLLTPSAVALQQQQQQHINSRLRHPGSLEQAYVEQAYDNSRTPSAAITVQNKKKTPRAPKRHRSAMLAKMLPLPEADGPPTLHYIRRLVVPLATEQDDNWLSEFLCFVRTDLIEVFRANEDDVLSRNRWKKVVLGQVGIRCRYCAHLPQNGKTTRSSSYPFTLSRIYQSLTMMLRDHFGNCGCIPAPIKKKFFDLKGTTSQGAMGSNKFWESSSRTIGLVDSPTGIWVADDTRNLPKPKEDAKSEKDRVRSRPTKRNPQLNHLLLKNNDPS